MVDDGSDEAFVVVDVTDAVALVCRWSKFHSAAYKYLVLAESLTIRASTCPIEFEANDWQSRVHGVAASSYCDNFAHSHGSSVYVVSASVLQPVIQMRVSMQSTYLPIIKKTDKLL